MSDNLKKVKDALNTLSTEPDYPMLLAGMLDRIDQDENRITLIELNIKLFIIALKALSENDDTLTDAIEKLLDRIEKLEGKSHDQ